MASTAEHILQVLEEAGVEYVFGIPGGGTSQIFALMHGREDRIKPILVRHEQVAGIMADAYGRATGKPAAVMGQGLFIGSNASFGIMEAMLSSSPMLVVTDTSDGGSAQHPANQSGAGEYGSIDLPAIFRAMTKYTTLAASPKEAVIGTQLALKHATTGRPGPAAVVMRSAAAGGEVDVESPPFLHHSAGYLTTAKPQSAPEDIAPRRRHPGSVAAAGDRRGQRRPRVAQPRSCFASWPRRWARRWRRATRARAPSPRRTRCRWAWRACTGRQPPTPSWGTPTRCSSSGRSSRRRTQCASGRASSTRGGSASSR